MATRPAQPFRFLDLPQELRIMVYENISMTTQHYHLRDPTLHAGQDTTPDQDSFITFVVKSLPVGILSTCRLVQAECKPYLDRLLDTLRSEPARFIVDSASLWTLSDDGGVAELIRQNERNIQEHGMDAPFVAERRKSVRYSKFFYMALGDPMLYIFSSPSSSALPILPSTERTAIAEFILKCARHMHTRAPSKVVVAVRRHPDCAPQRLIPGMRLMISQNLFRPPTNAVPLRRLEVVICGAFSDEELRGAGNNMLEQWALISGIADLRFGVLDDRVEWSRDWDFGGEQIDLVE